MLSINNKPADQVSKEELIAYATLVTQNRNQYKNITEKLEEIISLHKAEKDLLQSEINIYKQELEAMKKFRSLGCAN